MSELSTVAAVDLGSNSFHLLVARPVADHIAVVSRVRETVRLAAGLDDKGRLSEEAIARGIACLERFAQVAREFHPDQLRAVGTNTLRKARNRKAFLERAGEALGHPIEIISGVEEARLCYLGVAHTVGDAGDVRRLVVDIGGGSTECVLGEGFTPLEQDSLYMGCVSYSLRFFEDEKLDAARFEAARLAARAELEPLRKRYQSLGWHHALGSSGTVGAISALLRENGHGARITREGLDWLEEVLVDQGKASRSRLQGLKSDRAQVLPGGLAILQAVFRAFRLQEMTFSDGALREGLVYDLLGRIRHEDRRDQTIRTFQERYHVDRAQGARVEQSALALFDAAHAQWKLEPETDRRLLLWAARLHEVGLAVAYRGHHKHGAYLLRHADMPGFSVDEQIFLAALLRSQRRKLATESFEEVGSARRDAALRLSLFLRLSVLLRRSRSTRPAPSLIVEAKKDKLRLGFPEGWLEEHRLSRAELETEASYWSRLDLQLTFS